MIYLYFNLIVKINYLQELKQGNKKYIKLN